MTKPQPLLSRVADSVYWLSRYVERAGNVARYLTVNLNLNLDMPLTPSQQWQPLIDTTGDAELFKKRYDVATQENVIDFLAYDAEYPNSIASCLRAARENARSVRETISPAMWEQINIMYLKAQERREIPEPEQLLEAFQEVVLGCHLFYGIAEATMAHSEAWHFLRLGQMLERADKTSRILDVKYFMLLPSVRDVGTPYDDLHWSAVLKSVSGFEIYRKRYGLIRPRDVVEFMLMDREFPRAILYCVTTANRAMHRITGTPPGAFRFRSEQLLGQLESSLNFASVEEILRVGLHEYLDNMQSRMNEVDIGLASDFLLQRSYPQQQQQGSWRNA